MSIHTVIHQWNFDSYLIDCLFFTYKTDTVQSTRDLKPLSTHHSELNKLNGFFFLSFCFNNRKFFFLIFQRDRFFAMAPIPLIMRNSNTNPNKWNKKKRKTFNRICVYIFKWLNMIGTVTSVPFFACIFLSFLPDRYRYWTLHMLLFCIFSFALQ